MLNYLRRTGEQRIRPNEKGIPMQYANKLVAMTLLCLAAVASQGTVIRITVDGQMNLSNGTDANNLDGASFSAIYQYDNMAFFQDAATAESFFAPLSAVIDFTNRPAGASDVSILYQSGDRPLLRADNRFAPAPDNDQVVVLSSALATISEFPNDLRAPEFTFDLGTQDFFPGDQPEAELVFSTTDVSEFSATAFRFFSPNGDYTVSDTSFSVAILEDVDNDGVFDPDDMRQQYRNRRIPDFQRNCNRYDACGCRYELFRVRPEKRLCHYPWQRKKWIERCMERP